MRHSATIGLAGLATLLFGCARDQPTPSSEPIARDTLADGTVVVRFGDLSTLTPTPLAEDLRIGEVEGDANYVLGDVRSIDATSDGTIYVLDTQASEIRAYSPEGEFLRRVSGRGAGPGEITESNGFIILGDSMLWIQDYGQWMMIGVDLEGEEYTRFPMMVLSYGYAWNGTVDNTNRVWKQWIEVNMEQAMNRDEGLRENVLREHMVAFDPENNRADSIYVGDALYRIMVTRNARGGSTSRGVPNDARPITAVVPDGGLWRTNSDTYRIARLDLAGDTVLVIESDTPAPPVTGDDRDQYVERSLERAPDARRVLEEIAGLMPDTKPVIASLTVDDDGRLWVGRTRPRDAAPQFDVFNDDGNYLGSVELGFRPAGFLPIRIRQNRVYAVVRDGLDVPFVVRSAPLPYRPFFPGG